MPDRAWTSYLSFHQYHWLSPCSTTLCFSMGLSDLMAQPKPTSRAIPPAAAFQSGAFLGMMDESHLPRLSSDIDGLPERFARASRRPSYVVGWMPPAITRRKTFHRSVAFGHTTHYKLASDGHMLFVSHTTRLST